MSKKLINFSTPYILNGEFFEIISQEGESVTVRCCHCETRNIYKGSVKSTGNFHMHIKRKHPVLLPKVHELKLISYLNRKLLPRKKTPTKYFKNEANQDISPPQISNKNDLETEEVRIPTVMIHLNPEENTAINDNPIKSEDSYDESRSANTNSLPGSTSQDTPCDEDINESEVNREASITRLQLDDILPRIDNSLRNIEGELRLRNQIESNRLFLELAKFKYLHPLFDFRL